MSEIVWTLPKPADRKRMAEFATRGNAVRHLISLGWRPHPDHPNWFRHDHPQPGYASLEASVFRKRGRWFIQYID